VDDVTRRRVFALASEGYSQRAIGEELGLSRGAVWRALQASRPAAARRELDAEPLDAAYASSGWGAVILLGVALLAALLGRKPKSTPGTRPSVEPQPSPGSPPGGMSQTGSGWVVLPTGQVVWRGRRA
jgi:Homeodomain-like domain